MLVNFNKKVIQSVCLFAESENGGGLQMKKIAVVGADQVDWLWRCYSLIKDMNCGRNL